MGKCYKCGVEVTLKEEETKCDNCGEILRYWCWNCQQGFNIESKELKKKIKECSVCGYFYCPNCGSCGKDCQKGEWVSTIREILGGDCYLKLKNFEDKMTKLINFIEQLKLGKEHKNCPKGVPISYAKDKIKYAAARMQGYRTKGNYDEEKFNQRLKQIEEMDIGTEFTIDSIREDGAYGQEYRDASNYGVCIGKLKVEYKKNKQDKEYSLFKRGDGNPCQFLRLKDLVVDWCPLCKRRGVCQKLFSKGKKGGQQHQTTKKITNEDICQLSRGAFIKHGKE